jgi:peptide-methionine (S)-S-oxide reductase
LEKISWQLPGAYSTSVGFTGGFTAKPTYLQTCSGSTAHAKAVDGPSKIGYDQLLKAFWGNHDPTRPGSGARPARPELPRPAP